MTEEITIVDADSEGVQVLLDGAPLALPPEALLMEGVRVLPRRGCTLVQLELVCTTAHVVHTEPPTGEVSA